MIFWFEARSRCFVEVSRLPRFIAVFVCQNKRYGKEVKSHGQKSHNSSPVDFTQRSSNSCGSGSGSQHRDTLLPISAVRADHRSVFPFDSFNAIQSACLSVVYETDENVLVSAPTGSGKTAMFEMAILRLFRDERALGKKKVVFISPLK